MCEKMNWMYLYNGVIVRLYGDFEFLARRVFVDGVEKCFLFFGDISGEE